MNTLLHAVEVVVVAWATVVALAVGAYCAAMVMADDEESEADDDFDVHVETALAVFDEPADPEAAEVLLLEAWLATS